MGKVRLIASLLVISACRGQSLPQGDRDFALSALHASRKLFLDAVSNLSLAQLQWKPAAGRWSVMEIAEQVIATEELLPQTAAKALQSPAEPSRKQPNPRQMDAKILEQMRDRSQKAKAPGQLEPAGKYRNAAELTAAFQKLRDRNIAYIRETKDDLRSHFAPSPAGDLDALQWYLLMAGHTERHVLQMREVMAMPDFPKK